jgi:hypothetical protein
MFGCHTCDGNKTGNKTDNKVCTGFRAETETTASENLNDSKIAEAGMLKHVGEIATCTKCFMPVKIGEPGTLSAVISARAHVQICKVARATRGSQAI